MKKILFISHNASRSGAPILLLNLATLVNKSLSVKTDFVFLNEGPLLSQFELLGYVYFLHRKAKTLTDRIFFKLFNEESYYLSRIKWAEYDLVIVNTVVCSYLIPAIRKRFSGKLFLYLHEMSIVMHHVVAPVQFEKIASYLDLILVPSEAVKHDLLNGYITDANSIELLPYYIPARSNPQPSSAHSFIVGGCGTVEFRKGTDLFLQIARLYKEKYSDSPVQFVWQGAVESLEFAFLLKDSRSEALRENFRFEMSSHNMDHFYSTINVLLLTSREDPYPLVVLEAASHHVPTLCFTHSGGAQEFIRGAGQVVNYLDLNAMVEAIHEYTVNSELLTQDGNRAKEKVHQLHQNADVIADRVVEFYRKA